MKNLYLTFLGCLLTLAAYAQDPQFTQFYAAPLYLNPAFAGATFETRAIFNARAQWTALARPFITYASSIDHNFQKIRSGIGFIAMVDRAGSGGLTANSFSGIYSYKIPVTSKLLVRPAVQFSYASRSIDFYRLTFGDQLDINGSTGIATGEVFDRETRINYFDFSSGVLVHNEKAWFGFAAHHLNRPNQTLHDGDSEIPIKFTFHGGFKIDLSNSVYQKNYGKKREKSLTPAFNYRSQGNYDQTDVGLYYHYEPLVVGMWYRGIPLLKRYKPGYGNNDAVAVLLGFKQDNFTVGYSYDLTISRLGAAASQGSHEISISYTFPSNDKSNKKLKMKKKDMVIPCPKF